MKKKGSLHRIRHKVKPFKKAGNGFFILIALILVVVGGLVYYFISQNPAKVPQAATREVGKWPFARNSIWNLPIGASATYTPANFPSSTGNGINTEDEMVMVDPASPLRQTFMRTGQWNATCSGGSDFGSFHVPDGLTTPLTSGSFLPNNTGGALKSDDKTIQEGIWIARCSATGPLYWGYGQLGSHDIYGSGLVGGAGGGHGGSGLSAVGGSLRQWELQGDEPIRHALKLTVPTKVLSKSGNGGKGYKWPAVRADGGYDGSDCFSYSGSTQAAVMGAFVAVLPSVDVDSLVSTPLARRIGHAMQDYGVYIVDVNPCWDPFTFNVENKGNDVVRSRYGYGFGDNPLSGELFKLISRLNVVNNWDEAKYNLVKDTNGAQGAGGGAPRVAWAPDFGVPITSPSPESTTQPVLTTPSPTPTPPTPPAPTTTSLEAETMKINSGYIAPDGNIFSDSTASGGKGLALLSNGNATGTISGSFNTFKARVKGDQCNGAPNIIVKIDGKAIINQSVTSSNWTEITYNLPYGSGNHTIATEFNNDSNPGTCDRNLRLDKFWVETETAFNRCDLNKDGVINDADRKLISDNYFTKDPAIIALYDINGDKRITSGDLLAIATKSSKYCK